MGFLLVTMFSTPKVRDVLPGCWKCRVEAQDWGGPNCPLSQNSEEAGRAGVELNGLTVNV